MNAKTNHSRILRHLFLIFLGFNAVLSPSALQGMELYYYMVDRSASMSKKLKGSEKSLLLLAQDRVYESLERKGELNEKRKAIFIFFDSQKNESYRVELTSANMSALKKGFVETSNNTTIGARLEEVRLELIEQQPNHAEIHLFSDLEENHPAAPRDSTEPVNIRQAFKNLETLFQLRQNDSEIPLYVYSWETKRKLLKKRKLLPPQTQLPPIDEPLLEAYIYHPKSQLLNLERQQNYKVEVSPFSLSLSGYIDPLITRMFTQSALSLRIKPTLIHTDTSQNKHTFFPLHINGQEPWLTITNVPSNGRFVTDAQLSFPNLLPEYINADSNLKLKLEPTLWVNDQKIDVNYHKIRNLNPVYSPVFIVEGPKLIASNIRPGTRLIRRAVRKGSKQSFDLHLKWNKEMARQPLVWELNRSAPGVDIQEVATQASLATSFSLPDNRTKSGHFRLIFENAQNYNGELVISQVDEKSGKQPVLSVSIFMETQDPRIATVPPSHPGLNFRDISIGRSAQMRFMLEWNQAAEGLPMGWHMSPVPPFSVMLSSKDSLYQVGEPLTLGALLDARYQLEIKNAQNYTGQLNFKVADAALSIPVTIKTNLPSIKNTPQEPIVIQNKKYGELLSYSLSMAWNAAARNRQISWKFVGQGMENWELCNELGTPYPFIFTLGSKGTQTWTLQSSRLTATEGELILAFVDFPEAVCRIPISLNPIQPEIKISWPAQPLPTTAICGDSTHLPLNVVLTPQNCYVAPKIAIQASGLSGGRLLNQNAELILDQDTTSTTLTLGKRLELFYQGPPLQIGTHPLHLAFQSMDPNVPLKQMGSGTIGPQLSGAIEIDTMKTTLEWENRVSGTRLNIRKSDFVLGKEHFRFNPKSLASFPANAKGQIKVALQSDARYLNKIFFKSNQKEICSLEDFLANPQVMVDVNENYKLKTLERRSKKIYLYFQALDENGDLCERIQFEPAYQTFTIRYE